MILCDYWYTLLVSNIPINEGNGLPDFQEFSRSGSVRMRKALLGRFHSKPIDSWEKLLGTTAEMLRERKNVGETTIYDIRKRLLDLGMMLKDDQEWVNQQR